MGKPQTGREILDEVNESVKKQTKKAQKKETNMEKKSLIESIKTWTIVVLIGLIAVAGTYLYAFNQGVSAEKSRTEEIKAAAKNITASTTSLKQ